MARRRKTSTKEMVGFVVLAAIAAAITYWYVAIPAAIVIGWLALREQESQVLMLLISLGGTM